MFLHDVGFDKFNIACENTLISPQYWDDEPFELIVSNPPYSVTEQSVLWHFDCDLYYGDEKE